jgi:hypothetical protein
MKQNFIDIVKLIESPSARNPWYIVEGPKGKHYVSALGGRAAKGLREGSELKLYRNVGKQMSSYVLTR